MNALREIKQLPETLKTSAKELKNVKSLCGTAMLTALNVVAGMFSIPLTPTLKIGFSSVFAGLSGMVYGPLLTGFAGIIADNLKYILRPDGPYFPFFGINEFLTGMIYGAFFYKKIIILPRVIASRACITVLINLILTSLWLNIMYQSPLFTMVRLVKNIVLFPVDVAVLYFLLKAGEKILPKQ